MNTVIIKIRNNTIKFLYKNILKKIFFLQDPENIHDRITVLGKLLGKFSCFRRITAWLFNYQHQALEQNIKSIHFKNPIGLAAGFDKNGELTDILPAVGFGFAELGSITGEPCQGNPKPRLWRLKKSASLVVYYGLKNDGCAKIAKKLAGKKFEIPFGISIAKTNSPATCEIQAAIKDYVKAFSHFITIGDYFTINISCPNAFGGESFSDPIKLDQLLNVIDSINHQKPVFLKLAADLTHAQIDGIIRIIQKHRVDGLVCTNLTKNRQNPKIKETVLPQVGGISGKAVEDLATAMIRYVYHKTAGRYIIIGCGGIFSAADAYKKIKAGASLLQLITGMIFEGPQLISAINIGLVELLKNDGFKSISDAVGKEDMTYES